VSVADSVAGEGAVSTQSEPVSDNRIAAEMPTIVRREKCTRSTRRNRGTSLVPFCIHFVFPVN